MAPEKDIEILDLDELRKPIRINSRRVQIDKGIEAIEKQKQLRITIYHKVVHIIAFLILIPYISLILANVSVPDSYSTIVSVVIGFYFARSLFD